MRRFPAGFLWGAATSSHQVEGGNEGNDWWDWEGEPGKIRDGTRSGDACDWWRGRAEEDLALAASLGHNAHRASLEWSRLEPSPGHYDEAAFARYRRIFVAAREHGIALHLTLHHFTLPRWAAARGGWTDAELAPRFAAYAAECLKRLGDCTPLWSTMNEPSVAALMAYAGKRWPPGRGDPIAGYRALAVMLRAHALAYRAAKRARPEARIGIVLNAPLFDPYRAGSWRDRAVARAQDWAFTGVVLHALERGVLMPPLALVPTPVAALARSFDHVGLNYYGRYAVRFDPRKPALLFGRHVQSPTIRTPWNDWGQPYPEGLYRQLLRLGRLGVPLYVTENGIYDNDDSLRPDFLRDHVRAAHQALERGVDLRGYFHWSLIDNFEWAEGWATHFGLVALDRRTGAREPRPSAGVYAAICRANGLDD
jgi:beta-glucosidase